MLLVQDVLHTGCRFLGSQAKPAGRLDNSIFVTSWTYGTPFYSDTVGTLIPVCMPMTRLFSLFPTKERWLSSFFLWTALGAMQTDRFAAGLLPYLIGLFLAFC